jgi:hypothetical protein
MAQSPAAGMSGRMIADASFGRRANRRRRRPHRADAPRMATAFSDPDSLPMRFHPRRLAAPLLACLLMLGAGAAGAQLRTIPADAKRGELTHVQENIIKLDDKTLRLSPGALIRDANNVIVLPTMVPAASPVRYQLDAQGMLHRAWLLSPEEAARPQAPIKPVAPGLPASGDR